MHALSLSSPRVEPFFFDAHPGTRFCLYHAPAAHLPARGAILYVHPFAEELSLSRHAVARQARAFAAAGYAVLQLDLFGCGDSCGLFNAARWEIWQHDLDVARAWLAARTGAPLHLWGLGLGGLLALDFATQHAVESLLLWHPFLHGRACMNGFLGQHPSARSTAALRVQLATHGMIEVGGYEVALPLVKAIDGCEAARMRLRARRVHWCGEGSVRNAARAARLAAQWHADGVALQLHPLASRALGPALVALTHTLYAGDLP